MTVRKPYTVVGFHDADREVHTFTARVWAESADKAWRAAVAAECRVKRGFGDSHWRVSQFIDGATEIVTYAGHLEAAQ